MHRPNTGARPLPVIHAVTNDEIVGRAGFVERAREVMEALGGRGALQLRAPRLARSDASALLSIARSLADVQAATGAWLVINDRIDIALIARAWGIQLAGTSVEPGDAARVIVGVLDADVERDSPSEPLCVGASVHSLEEGIAARLGGASWAVVSHVLAGRGAREDRERHVARSRDDDAPRTGTTLLQNLVRHCGVPIVAIGGIVPQHVSPLRKLGVHGIAAIRGIWDAENAARSAIDYVSAYDSEVGR